SVAATDHNDGRAGFSNYGATSVDLAAPGVSIYSTVPGNGYASYSGTSMATPHVAGVVGLLAAGNPQATVDQIKAAIMDGADTVASMAGRAVTGGRLNAYNALQLIGGQDIRPPTVESVSPSGIFAPVDTITIVFSEDILAQSVVGGNFLLRSSGADGVFDTPDDNVLTIDTASLSQAQPNRVVINLGQMLPVGGYRLTLVDTGENPIRDPAGNALGGGDAIHFFEIAEMVYVSEPNDILAQAVDSGLNGTGDAIFSGTIGDGAVGARDVDLFALQVEAGMVLSADIDAWENGSTLNSLLRVFDADGNELTFNDDIHGSDSFIEYALTRAGTYYVGVSGFGNFSYDPLAAGGELAGSTGDYILTMSLAPAGDYTGPEIEPDGYGYTARTVAFAFEDISSFGTIGLSPYADDSVFAIAPGSLSGFDFDFYGQDRGSVYVSSNGIITFGGGYDYYNNSDLTSSPTYAVISPFWDDLVVGTSGGSVLWNLRGSGGQQRLIVQWEGVRFYGYSGGGVVTFQAVLYESNNSIQFNYLDLDVSHRHAGGALASVGIKDAGAQTPAEHTLPISINNGPNSFVGTGLSIRIMLNGTAPVLDIPDQTMSHNEDTRPLDLPATDADGDAVSYTVVSVKGPGRIASDLRDRLRLTSRMGRWDNICRAGEKWFLDATRRGRYYLLSDGGLYRMVSWNRKLGQLNGRLEGYVDVQYYDDPNSLLTAQPEDSPPTTVTMDGSRLTIDPADGFVGRFVVQLSATDGLVTVSDSFTVAVTNAAPQVDISDQAMSRGQDQMVLTLPAIDADGDAVTYTVASVKGPGRMASDLRDRLGLTSRLGRWDNICRAGEKWFLDATRRGRYYLLSDGGFYRMVSWNRKLGQLNGRLEGYVDVQYYDDPNSLLTAHPEDSLPTTVTMDGSRLTIDPADDFVGRFVVEVSADDGLTKISDSFTVAVTNAAPQMAISDQAMSRGQDQLVLTLPAVDADGDVVTYTVLSVKGPVATAVALRDRLGLAAYVAGSDNACGAGEKWFQDNRGGWHYMLDDGSLYAFASWNRKLGQLNGYLEGRVDEQYYDAPEGLLAAESSSAAATVSVEANQLTIDPADGFAGQIMVEMQASDALVSVTDSFSVMVA
ncbi:MAG: DVUA0089 family protein, partial [Phycisphaerae bacterium]|nr:DVUA0089 family protein [Phycisphaerae bacterium]